MTMQSIWKATTPPADAEALRGELQTDVVVVGGGITGITLAWLLAAAGRSVAVLDAGAIGAGDTGGSTGNLYATVSDGLREVRAKWDVETACDVAASRGAAVNFIERQANRLGADACAFRRCPLHLYAVSNDAQEAIAAEHGALREAGLDAQWQDHTPAGVPTAAGRVLVLANQAQFHPLAYTRLLAHDARRLGASIHENSPVLEVDADHGRVRTAAGSVRARGIVLATHSPIGIHRVHTGMLARREYGLAFALERPFPSGIFWGRGEDGLSLRGLDTGGSSYLICIGGQGATGNHDEQATMAHLEQTAASRLQRADPRLRWSAQHFHSPDHLPYVGTDASGCHIATGFATDGLTYGTLAATIIANALTGQDNRWERLYRANRLDLVKSARGVAEVSASSAKGLARNVLDGRAMSPEDLQPGQGELVEHDGETIAAYRDRGGRLFTVSPVCTHMKCRVSWNALETSWDCPCHGSRFAPDGSVLEGPALQPLEPVSFSGATKT